MVSKGCLKQLSFSLSLAETTGFCSLNSGGPDVYKCKRWKKVEKQLVPKAIYISWRKRIIPKTNYYVDANPKRKLSVAFSRKGSDNYMVNAAASNEELFESQVLHSNSSFKTLHGHFNVFYRFSRLHIFFGKVWGLVAISLLVVEKISDFTPSFFIGLFQVLTACFLTHVYTNGLNHLEDIEIDRINKPYRPLASGEYSFTTGVILTLSSALMAVGVGWIVGSPHLFLFILMNLMAATAYSLNVPYLRWKSNAYLAAFCIFIGLAPSGLAAYLHIQTFVFGRPALLSKPIMSALTKACFAAVVVALFKDIPDVAGDKIHGVQSLAVKFGGKKVFWICIFLLQIGYLAGVSAGLTSSNNWCKFITVAGHLFLSLTLWSRAKCVDVGSKEETSSFYMFLLKLFSVESLLIPFMR
ncbi:OLC1v1035865C1 [Oldenlandia corymbosa var. corymbosa]|uniref:OLC1v1035865C1 n=1 Tax=Oldenlandia corymbosa var. corymbosa TaxID=529605 RepID=A0AAV1CU05_OLDCO|nr:OLC1v1035865C1 [Oldenlandia corymbosa var. corymbosa]